MLPIEDLVKVGFTLPSAKSLDAYFRNVGYLTTDRTCVKTGVNIPENGVMVLDSLSYVDVLKSDSQEFIDVDTAFVQNANTNPNKGNVNNIVVYFADQGTGETYADLFDEMCSINANFAQFSIKSREATDIVAVAVKAVSNGKIFIPQTKDTDVANGSESNIAKTMAGLNNSNTMLVYHGVDTEALGMGLAAITAQGSFGSVGALYSTVTNVMPQDYTSTINGNLKNQNCVFYTTTNPVGRGGGIEQYAEALVFGSSMINGEKAKRRYIRYYFDIVLKQVGVQFLKKKLGYEGSSSAVLESMLSALLVAGQTNNLIRKSDFSTGKEVKGFEVKVLTPEEIRIADINAYNAQKYLVKGYYRDVLTGETIDIDLTVDPSDIELAQLGF